GEVFNPAQLRLILAMARENDAHYPNLAEGKTILEQSATQNGVDPWIAAMCNGRVQIEQAWKIRGGGWAADVKPEAWPLFAQHIDKARNYLLKATELRPEFPEGWASLIEVAMARSDPLDDYFAKGLAAEIDNSQVWTQMLWALRPRWSGNYALMLDAGMKG